MTDKKKAIKDIIYREYFRAALLPILIIEVTLLIMYFGITGYIAEQTQQTLLAEARQNIEEISKREGKNIGQQIDAVTELATILQKENTLFFDTYDSTEPRTSEMEFQKAENGVTYKRDNNGGSSVFYSNITPFGEPQRKKAIMTESFDSIFKAVMESDKNIVGVYFNSFDSMCRYYPFLPEVYTVFPANMDIPLYNFYYKADPQNNPERKTTWTDVYLDPAGQGWMASCITPIYDKSGFLQGVTGIDITVDRMIDNILNLKLPWEASAFLVDQNGVILAMPKQIEEAMNLKELRKQVYESTVKQDTLKPEEFNLLKNKDRSIAEQMKNVLGSNALVHDVAFGGKSYFLTQSVIEKTGWHLMILVDKAVVFEPVYKLGRLTNRTGIMAFIAMLMFYALFFSYLLVKSKATAKRIADPIGRLADKSIAMESDIKAVVFDDAEEGIEEIDLLLKNFRSMGERLSEFYEELDEKVKLRTAELEKAYLELKFANQQIVNQEKMASIGQLAAGVAHEINNPMGFVISNVGIMQEYADKMLRFLESMETVCANATAEEQEKITKYKAELGIDYIREDVSSLISETLDGTERVKHIVDELRSFARISEDVELVDIHIGLEGVLKIIGNELKYKVQVTRDYGDIPQVLCNQGQLNQVFMNLLMNAAQAIEETGEITIRTGMEEGMVTIRISDTGTGVPEEFRSRVFDPFFTTKPVGVGTGLGLSVSYEIMKRHNGELILENSSALGTTFLVKIPVVEA